MPARVCPVCAGLARNWRTIHRADQEEMRALGKKAEDPLTPLPGDGRHFSLVPASAGEQRGQQEQHANAAGDRHSRAGDVGD